MAEKHGAALIIDLLKMAGVENIAVAGHTPTVVYSQAVPMPRNATFCFNVKSTSSGTVKLVIEFESANEEPGTEEVADGNYVVPDGKSEVIADLTDELMHRVPYSPAATQFGRFKISSGVGNDASTVIDLLQISYVLNI